MMLNQYKTIFSVMLSILIAIGIIWTPIEELARANGTLYAEEKPLALHAPEPGKILLLPFHVGDHVTLDTQVATLDTQWLEQELAFIREQIQVAEQAQCNWKWILDRAKGQEEVSAPSDVAEAVWFSWLAQKNLWLQKISDQTAYLSEYQKTQKLLTQAEQLAFSEKERYANLWEKGHVSEQTYHATEQRWLEQKRQLEQIHLSQQQGLALLAQWKQEYALAEQTWLENYTQRYQQAIEQLALLRPQQRQIEMRIESMSIKAPVEGYIAHLHTAPGHYIHPSEQLMTLIPTHPTLSIQAQVLAEDRPHLHIGDLAKVHLAGYPAQHRAALEARVTRIAPDITTTQQGLPYYEVMLALEKETAGYDLSSGLPVELVIHTGRTTLLQYWLAPIQKSLRYRFYERLT